MRKLVITMTSKKKLTEIVTRVTRCLVLTAAALGMLGTTSVAEAYNRHAAVDYARRFVIITNPAYPVLPTDCTNFVSQCLLAGGMQPVGGFYLGNRPTDWYPFVRRPNGFWLPASWSWTAANNLDSFLFLSQRGRYVRSTQLQPGDLIFADGFDTREPGTPNGIPDHVMIVIGTSGSDVFYAQHSSNKTRWLSDARRQYPNASFRYVQIR